MTLKIEATPENWRGEMMAAVEDTAIKAEKIARLNAEIDRLREALLRVRVNLVGSNSRERKRLIEYIGSVLKDLS